MALPAPAGSATKRLILAGAVLLAAVVSYLDYLTGPHITISEFYLLPLAMVALACGIRSALFVALLSVGLWSTANILNGGLPNLGRIPFASWAAAQLISYVVIVVVLTRLRVLQSSLEQRVVERADALTREVRERERLQNELLGVSEREQRRIGQDLHDGLCQHLAGTALTCQALHEELAEKGLLEAARAQKVVELIEEGLVLSRRSAKGLHPADMAADGLMAELEEFAATTTRLFQVHCRLECDSPVLMKSGTVGEHMYRIAQEAVRNAVKHGRAENITIALTTLDDGLELRIEDDGTGFDYGRRSGTGLGLRIMPYRASMIGAMFSIGPRPGGGTVVSCQLPLEMEMEDSKRDHAVA